MIEEKHKMSGDYFIQCYESETVRNLLWEAKISNLITTEGLYYDADVSLLGGSQLTGWHILLTDGTPTVAAADTMSSHAGWVEVTAYSGSRPSWVGVRTLLVSTNSASVASFTMNGSGTAGGCGLTSDATGTAGTLYSVGAFSAGDQPFVSGNVIEVTYSSTVADA